MNKYSFGRSRGDKDQYCVFVLRKTLVQWSSFTKSPARAQNFARQAFRVAPNIVGRRLANLVLGSNTMMKNYLHERDEN